MVVRLLRCHREAKQSRVWISYSSDMINRFTEALQRQGGVEYNCQRDPAWQSRTDEGIASRMDGILTGLLPGHSRPRLYPAS